MKSFFDRLNAKLGGERSPAAIGPPELGGAVRFPYGPFRFETRVAGEANYEIEATTNLKSWSKLSSGTVKLDLEFVDSDASKFSYRFYRLRADGVLSRNVIGYASVTLPPGFSMVANPLQATDSRVATLFKEMPDGTTVSRFDTRFHQLTENNVQQGKWSNPEEKFEPGEGAIVFNPTSDYKSISFVGEVIQGNFSTPIPAGFSVRSSPVPQPGRLDTELGFPIDEGDVVHLFDRDKQAYVLYPYDPATWARNPPVVSVGESFWIAKKLGRNWVRNCWLTQ